MSRLVNIMMVCVWLISQTLVVSNSQAHAAMGHQQHLTMAAQTEPHSDHDQHHHVKEAHSHGQKKAFSDHGVPADIPHSMDECCDVACQSATVLDRLELAIPHETSATFKFIRRTVSCWSPGFATPPPNPAA